MWQKNPTVDIAFRRIARPPRAAESVRGGDRNCLECGIERLQCPLPEDTWFDTSRGSFYAPRGHTPNTNSEHPENWYSTNVLERAGATRVWWEAKFNPLSEMAGGNFF